MPSEYLLSGHKPTTAMTVTFFDLPVELRLDVYRRAFGKGKVIFTTSRSDTDALLPVAVSQQSYSPRSAQLLRVCNTILHEARPVLYSNTTVHILSHVFAGKHPSTFTNGHPIAPYVKHLIWQLDCDMMKHLYPEDVQLQASDLAQLSSVELRCRAETWRHSFLGEECDRDKFVTGREEAIEYARMLQHQMGSKADLVEDRTFLGNGCVVLKLRQTKAMLATNVSPQRPNNGGLKP